MNQSRRALLKSAGAALVVGAALRRPLNAASFDPLEKSIRELQRAMAGGQLSSLGTDTAGSIRIPSCHNNVVGLRPTIGLPSRAGIIPSRPDSRGYDIALPAASLDQIAGVYLHRRVNRPNGGVAHILAKSASARVEGAVTLSEPEAADLRAGKLYLAVVGKQDLHLSARAELALRD